MKKPYFYSAFLRAYTGFSRRVKTSLCSGFFQQPNSCNTPSKGKNYKIHLFLPSAENLGHALTKQSL
jgi:hypothetical protein